MIGVDTSVLIRYLTADDPEQHRVACTFFKDRTPQDPAFISAVTLAETVWVLRRKYQLAAEEIADSVGMILNSDDFIVEGGDALQSASSGKVVASRIADMLVAFLCARAGCRHTLTFDREAARTIPSMELLV